MTHLGRLRATALLLVVLFLARAAGADTPRATSSHTSREARSRHFVLVGDIDAPTLAREARRLERLVQAVALALPELRPDTLHPVQIFLFGDDATLSTYDPDAWHGPAAEIGYRVRGLGGECIAAVESSGRTAPFLAHEAVHAMEDASLPGLPVWAGEGLAMLFSSLDAQGHLVRVGALPAGLGAVTGRQVPVRELFDLEAPAPHFTLGSRRDVIFSESWAIAHAWLMRRDGRLASLLTRLVAGESSVAVIASLYGPGAPDSIDRSISMYAGNFVLPTLTFTLLETFDAIPVSISELGPAEALSRLGTLLANGGGAGVPLAREHFEAALASDPHEPMAPGWLTAIAAVQADSAGIERWLARVSSPEAAAIAARALVIAELRRASATSRAPGPSDRFRRASAIIGAIRGLPDDPWLTEAAVEATIGDTGFAALRGFLAASVLQVHEGELGIPESASVNGVHALHSVHLGDLRGAVAWIGLIPRRSAISEAGLWTVSPPWKEWATSAALADGLARADALSRSGHAAGADSILALLQPMADAHTRAVLERTHEAIEDRKRQDAEADSLAREATRTVRLRRRSR